MSTRNLAKTLLGPLEWFYPTAKAMYMWRMDRALRTFDDGPILILQMGKVGSKSIQAGLEAASRGRPIYHAHFLSVERTARTEQQRKKFFRTARQSYLQRPWLNQFLLNAYRNGKAKGRWKIVTLTREPVGRNISAFFENLHVMPLEGASKFVISSDYYEIEPLEVAVDDIDTLRELFLSRATHDSPLKFFDREIKDIFGIDVLATGFSRDEGYQVYAGERADLLVIRLESLAACASKAFSEFLGIEQFKVIDSNIGARKDYAPLYKAFKRGVAISPGYADRLYDSEYMRTFYSEDEIVAFRNEWLEDARHVPA